MACSCFKLSFVLNSKGPFMRDSIAAGSSKRLRLDVTKLSVRGNEKLSHNTSDAARLARTHHSQLFDESCDETRSNGSCGTNDSELNSIH